MAVNNFQVNILDVLGLQFNEYLSKVKALSLTQPNIVKLELQLVQLL